MKKYLYGIGLVTLGGLIFSGYLSATKLFTDTCAFNEPCPYFLGYPACWYGFVMYLIMFTATVAAVLRSAVAQRALTINLYTSLLGILFAGSFTVIEVLRWFGEGTVYALVVPTCAYGLVFYVIIFAISLRYRLTQPT